MTRSLVVALALVACTGEPPADKPDTSGIIDGDDTGDTDIVDTDDTDPNCEAVVLSTEPADGATAVYYRDPMVVSFESDASGAVFTLADAGGTPVEFATEWSEGDLQAVLSTVLQGSTTYTLTADVCGVVTSSTFTTSSLGTPLTGPPSDLLGRAFVWRLSEAEITEPAILGFVASEFLTVPLLIGVTQADTTSIELLGGVGHHEDNGTYTQVPGEETWDFPAGDFAAQPYFEAYAEYITIGFDGADIPIEQFHLSGTFTADGTSIQKGVGSGFGDTRDMGQLIEQPDNPDAICNIAAEAGVPCVPCVDGQPYCLYIVAEDITAVWEAGLTIEPAVAK